ncbi:PREDICTED: calcium uniporter protein 2, mitochondrial-like [Tarenaya hassleriana]|uniref:calcium uniporter protein 2, mitochondrial-like n=1 Tax=Tarenaya hassleriana TaxID=28532 RepID=UPI00053C82A9|nr:PREDICTED: calcium uniporter protein 2, mitochondrial-like [Tarenaya hassleriana]
MAMRKPLTQQRLFNISKMASQSLMNCRISSSSLAVRTRIPKDPGESDIVPEPGDSGVIRRFLHQSSMIRPDILKTPMGGNLIEKLREMDLLGERMRLEGLAQPVKSAAAVSEEMTAAGLTVEDARKFLRAAQIEAVKSRLRETGRSWIPYAEFVRVCGEACSDSDQGSQIAKILDDSGNVIVLGKSVCLRPDQVTKSIEGLLPLPHVHNPNDPRRKELDELEAKKAVIDKKAGAMVQRELWAGLGYLILQTAGFMRLTFWELSWDVMEPICFYVTSVYFMAGYAFFLRTSKEPSFEGFYQSRFEAKQRKLMNRHEFDVGRYEELKKLFHPKASSSAAPQIAGVLPNQF